MSIQTNLKPNGHMPHARITAAEATCPTCKQPITKAIQARITAEEKARQERFAAELHAAKIKAAEAAQKEIEKVKKDALAAVAETRRQAQVDQKALRKQATDAALATVSTKVAEAVNAEKLRHTAEKLKLTDQLEDMKRRLEQKTAFQLGELSEINLFEALEAAFPNDRVSRVPKGQRGADVVMEIIDGGAVVGRIVLDSKNYSPSRWSNALTKKLRADQLAEGADFAVLVSTVFPAGKRQLHIQDGVIVADPDRVVVLVHLLRDQIVRYHILSLGANSRNEKADALYAFILSPAYSDMVDRLLVRIMEMDTLQAKEVAEHNLVWKKRKGMTDFMRETVGEFSSAVSAIIAGEPA